MDKDANCVRDIHPVNLIRIFTQHIIEIALPQFLGSGLSSKRGHSKEYARSLHCFVHPPEVWVFNSTPVIYSSASGWSSNV